MGAKAWFAAYWDTDPKPVLNSASLDEGASITLAQNVLPNATLDRLDNGELAMLNPDDTEIFVGVYGDLKVIAYKDFGGDYPSQVPSHWLSASLGRNIYMHATHSVVNWFACAAWRDGQLIRALSLSSDGGIVEDTGEKLLFEAPFWDGSMREVEDEEEDFEDPLPFHPLDMAEAALLNHLGFEFEGHPDNWVYDPYDVPICRFKVSLAGHDAKPWWKIW